MKVSKALKEIVVVLSVFGLCLFFLILLLGLRNLGQTEIPEELLSDNWFHTPHPVLVAAIALILVYIFCPIKFTGLRISKKDKAL